MVSAQEVRSLYDQGMTLHGIAKALHVRTTKVVRIADEIGLKRRRGAHTLPQDWRVSFLRKVKQAGPDQCWSWLGGTNGDGYGRHHVWLDGKRKTKQAHHVAYFLEHGKWPAYLLHSCDSPACCNPGHLREGTHSENVHECWEKGRGRRFKFTHLVPQIREMIAAGARNRDICKALGVKNDAVSRIRHGHNYGEHSRARA